MAMSVNNSRVYIDKARRMVRSYLKHTDHPILLVTNKPQRFKDLIGTGRLIISYISDETNTYKQFDYTLKLKAIEQAHTYNFDCVYWMDCDLFTTGWHEESFQKLLKEDIHVWGTSSLNHHTPPAWAVPKQKSTPITRVYSTREDRLIFNNKDKLNAIIDMWNQKDHWEDRFHIQDSQWRTYDGSDGMMIGSAINDTNTIYKPVLRGVYEFTKYEKGFLRGSNQVRDRWWGRRQSYKKIHKLGCNQK